MAIWQFGFHYVPVNTKPKRELDLRSRVTDQEREEIIDWSISQPPSESLSRLRLMLGSGKSWSENLEILGDLEATCVSIYKAQGVISEISSCVDLRSFSSEILNAMLEFAVEGNCLLLTDDNKLIRPTLSEVKAEIRNSPAYRFVKDPQGFIANMASGGEPER